MRPSLHRAGVLIVTLEVDLIYFIHFCKVEVRVTQQRSIRPS